MGALKPRIRRIRPPWWHLPLSLLMACGWIALALALLVGFFWLVGLAANHWKTEFILAFLGIGAVGVVGYSLKMVWDLAADIRQGWEENARKRGER